MDGERPSGPRGDPPARGATLAERLGPRRARPLDALWVAGQVADALGRAHARGVVHGRLEPAKVFLADDGHVEVLDLGPAPLDDTAPGAAGGAPHYMAPEQAAGARADARADVFAVGAVLFEMLAGAPPFEVRDGRSAALDGKAPRRLPGSIPEALQRLVGRCLDGDPERRPANGLALAEEVRALEAVLGTRRAFRRTAIYLALAIAVGFTLAALAAWHPWRR
ncbi:MAG TPA: protein kinase [Anaeromyxobacteraceae bacterium]|jgi:serine/threonine-protein kinase